MSAPGESYTLGTFLGPDSRFTEDLSAIDEYVKSTRSRIPQFPSSQSLIEDYERWRQELGWSDMNVFPNDTMNTAKAKRDAINAAQKNVTPATHSVEPGSFITPPPDETKNVVSSTTKLALYAGAGFAAVLLVVSFVSQLNPLALATSGIRRISRR